MTFFKEKICPTYKSISNFVDKIDFFDEEDGILTEAPRHSLYLRHLNQQTNQVKKECSCPCTCGAMRVSDREFKINSPPSVHGKIEKYFLFIKAPDIKEKKKPVPEMSKQDAQLKKLIIELLGKTETLQGLKYMITDPNSVSEIMKAI